MNKPQLLQTIETTKPATFSCIVGIAAAYERLWTTLDANPQHTEFVAMMLSLLHSASIIPRMENL